MTTAFVLSGGGIRGPLQVGALRSLLEHGINPDFFVGTSAGSINSAFMAARGPIWPPSRSWRRPGGRARRMWCIPATPSPSPGAP